MRVVFMGTPEFAVPILEALATLHEVLAVYTRPDAVSGRGSRPRPSPVKETASRMGLEVVQPVTLRDPAVLESLAELAPDVIVVAAYGLILPPEVLALPVHGCVNVHASLLPRWRGAAPIQRAILAGDVVTGISIMRMEEGLDTGPFCTTASTTVDEKTTDELTIELAHLGAEALIASLEKIRAGTCEWTAQDDTRATYAAKIEKHELELSHDLSLEEALRMVRAATSQAPARLVLEDRRATVLDACSSETRLAPGAIACQKRALLVGVADGTLMLERVRPDGKGEMRGCDWARGAHFSDDARWEQ